MIFDTGSSAVPLFTTVRRWEEWTGLRLDHPRNVALKGKSRGKEVNGRIERFCRTLKEQLLWLRRFGNLHELRDALTAFRQRYNEHWILERVQYRTPAQARHGFSLELGQAA